MTYSNLAAPKAQGRIIPTVLGLFLSACVSVLHVNIIGKAITLTWLPLLVILFWPKRIAPIWSVVLFLLAGLFVDWASGGAPGQWGLIYLTCLAVLNPAYRKGDLTLSGLIRNWLIIMLIAAGIFTLSGWFVYGQLPMFEIMAQQALLVTAMLPLYYVIRRIKRAIFGDHSERD